jgi:hypothetical protein
MIMPALRGESKERMYLSYSLKDSDNLDEQRWAPQIGTENKCVMMEIQVNLKTVHPERTVV